MSRSFWETSQMDEPRDREPGEPNDTPPACSAPGIVPGSRSDYNLIRPSPWEGEVHKILVGPDGLRPIWRFCLYLLMYGGLRLCLQSLIYYALPDLRPILWLQTIGETGLAIVRLAP